MSTLTSSQKTISSVKEKVKNLKRGAFTQQVDEKKNKR
jgi:signal transduction histidine kinase